MWAITAQLVNLKIVPCVTKRNGRNETGWPKENEAGWPKGESGSRAVACEMNAQEARSDFSMR